MCLEAKLSDLSNNLSNEDREHYKLLLSLACGGFLSSSDTAENTASSGAYKASLAAISNLQPNRKEMRPDGIIYRGRPEFMTDELLDMLDAESRHLYPESERFTDHLVSTGQKAAKLVAFSEQLRDLVSDGAGAVVPTGKTNYLYYDTEGMGIEPHIDNHEFPLNTILMLDHKHIDQPSCLVLYPKDREPIRLDLKRGELIIFYADSVMHAREKMKKNEIVRIVAFGFKPV